MDKKDLALKMAIKAMQFEDKSWECEHGFNHDECPNEHCIEKNWFATIQACKEALEQPAQEPYRCHWVEKGKGHCERNKRMGFADDYGHPAPSWQGLSDDEIRMLEDTHKVQGTVCSVGVKTFARAIEQALKEKNHG